MSGPLKDAMCHKLVTFLLFRYGGPVLPHVEVHCHKQRDTSSKEYGRTQELQLPNLYGVYPTGTHGNPHQATGAKGEKVYHEWDEVSPIVVIGCCCRHGSTTFCRWSRCNCLMIRKDNTVDNRENEDSHVEEDNRPESDRFRRSAPPGSSKTPPQLHFIVQEHGRPACIHNQMNNP